MKKISGLAYRTPQEPLPDQEREAAVGGDDQDVVNSGRYYCLGSVVLGLGSSLLAPDHLICAPSAFTR